MENQYNFSEHEVFHNGDAKGGGFDTNAAISAGTQLVGEFAQIKAAHDAKKAAGISKSDIKAHCGNDPFFRFSKKQKQKHQDFLKCKADYLDSAPAINSKNKGGGGTDGGGGGNDTPPPPKNHTMTYVIVGVAAVALIGGGILLFKHMGKSAVPAAVI